jgi:hypothetical protein
VTKQWRLIRVDDDYALGSHRNLFVLIWRRETTIDGCRAFRDELFRFAEDRPQGIGLLTIVEEMAPMPPTESRQSIASTLRDASDHIHASAVVFEGAGFRAAAVRSVVVGLTMLARQKFPHKVFGKLSDAATWMHATLGDALEEGFSAVELEKAVAEIRRAVEDQSS